MSWQAIMLIIFLVMLAALGHTVWHTPMLAIGNFIMTVFTGSA